MAHIWIKNSGEIYPDILYILQNGQSKNGFIVNVRGGIQQGIYNNCLSSGYFSRTSTSVGSGGYTAYFNIISSDVYKKWKSKYSKVIIECEMRGRFSSGERRNYWYCRNWGISYDYNMSTTEGQTSKSFEINPQNIVGEYSMQVSTYYSYFGITYVGIRNIYLIK